MGELTWGQRQLWAAMRRQRSWMPIGVVQPLPPGTTVAGVVRQLRSLLSRHPSLRTRLRFDPDGCRQVVAAGGEVPLEIVDLDRAADPGRVAAQVAQSYRDTGYDVVADWPVRMAVIRHGGTLTHRVLVMCHLVTDAFGAGLLMAELAGTGTTGRPPTDRRSNTRSPLERARWQCSPAGARVCQAALRHWEAILRTIPPGRFRGPVDPGRPRYREAWFESTALQLAVRAIAGRTRTTGSLVLLTLFAVAQARLTGIHPQVIQVLVSNQFRPGLAGSVSPVAQTGLCVLDLAGLTLDQAVARARGRALAAYKHAYYDPVRMAELVARVSRERGEQIDLECYFNDRRLAGGGEHSPAVTPGQLSAARTGTRFRWRPGSDRPFERLAVHVEDLPDRVGVTCYADTRFLAPADLVALVHGMEEVAVDAAFDPAYPAAAAEGCQHRSGQV